VEREREGRKTITLVGGARLSIRNRANDRVKTTQTDRHRQARMPKGEDERERAGQLSESICIDRSFGAESSLEYQLVHIS